MITIWVFLALLLLFAIIDIRKKAIPSVFLTAVLFVLAFVRFLNFHWAVVMSLLGLLLWEFSEGNKVAFGVADIKVMAMLGFFVSSAYSMLIMMLMIGIGQFLYINGLRSGLKVKEVPFLPFFFIVYVIGLATGVLT